MPVDVGGAGNERLPSNGWNTSSASSVAICPTLCTKHARRFCVIPFHARESAYFCGVFEDAVRVSPSSTYHARLPDAHGLDFTFDMVLSPAHQLTNHVVEPLLHAITQGGSAILIVSLTGTNEAVSEEGGLVAMELYAGFLPMLFHAARDCDVARLSVALVAGRNLGVMDDVLSGRSGLRTWSDLECDVIERGSSASRWGDLMRLFSARHESKLSAGSALVVRVSMEGYGEVIIMETGSSTDTLRELNSLVSSLRSNQAAGVAGDKQGERPLASLLSIPSASEVVTHFVAIPDPTVCEETSTKVLQFSSDAAACVGVDAVGLADVPTSRDSLECVGLGHPPRRDGRYAWSEELLVEPQLIAAQEPAWAANEGRAQDSNCDGSTAGCAVGCCTSSRRLRAEALSHGPSPPLQSTEERWGAAHAAARDTHAVSGVELPRRMEAQGWKWGGLRTGRKNPPRDKAIPALLMGRDREASAPRNNMTMTSGNETMGLSESPCNDMLNRSEGNGGRRGGRAGKCTGNVDTPLLVSPRSRSQRAGAMQNKSTQQIAVQLPNAADGERGVAASLPKHYFHPSESLEVGSKDGREQAILDRLVSSEHTNRELSSALASARTELRHMAHSLEVTHATLQKKQESLLAADSTATALRCENAQLSATVARLLKRIDELNTKLTATTTSLAEAVAKHDVAGTAANQLRDELKKAKKEVKFLQRKESARARLAILNSLDASIASPDLAYHAASRVSHSGSVEDVGRQRARHASRGRGGPVTGADEKCKDEASSLAHVIVQLRRQNTQLEEENRKLLSDVQYHQNLTAAVTLNSRAERGARAEDQVDEAHADPVGEAVAWRLAGRRGYQAPGQVGYYSQADVKETEPTPSGACGTCESFRVKLKYFATELSRARAEKDRLQHILVTAQCQSRVPLVGAEDTLHGGRPSPSALVVSAMEAGCASLRAQLACYIDEVQRLQCGSSGAGVTLVRHGADFPPLKVLKQHDTAVDAVEKALADIASKQCADVTRLPRTATAADAEVMARSVNFEVERCTHIMAFIPTFAQLSVALEHVKMRATPLQ